MNPHPGPCSGWVLYPGGSHTGFLDWASGGRRLAFGADEKIGTVDTDGTRARIVVDPVPDLELWATLRTYGYHADVSPDGNRVVYASCEFPGPRRRNFEIAIANIDGTGRQRLTSNGHFDNYPTWSPDGTLLAFIGSPVTSRFSDRHYQPLDSHIFIASADGVKIVPNTQGVGLYPPVWSPDGREIAFTVNEPVEGEEGRYYPLSPYNRILYVIRIDGSDLRKIGRATTLPAWSPDGLRVAFGLDDRVYAWELGTFHLSPLLDGFRANQVSWSPDGTELLLASDRGVYVVAEDGSNLRAVGPVNIRVMDAIWSPGGSMIAARHEFQVAHSPQLWAMSIFVMARDGTDVRFLAEGFVDDESNVRASGTRPPSNDPAECSAGVIVPEPETNRGLVKDCEALLWMRNTFSLHVVSNWNADTPIAEWRNVAVRGNPPRVRELSLWVDRGASGPNVSPELSSLTTLEKLDLSDSLLTSISPLELGKLTNLRELNLGYNRLAGPIPPELGNLTMLKELYLSNNDLSGPLPPEMAGLTMLESLTTCGSDPAGQPDELYLSKIWLPDYHAGELDPNRDLPDLWVEASGLERCKP